MKNYFLLLFFVIIGAFGMKAQPPAPVTPIPQHEATNVSVAPVLSWTVENWNPTCRYDVYLGLSPSPPLRFENLKDPQVLVTGLLANVKYYWFVAVHDSVSRQVFSPLWSFTTRKNPVLPIINHEYIYYPNEKIITRSILGTPTVGEDGPNAVWDFSAFIVSETTREIKYLNPSETPFVGGFPMANVALRDANNVYHYFRYNNQGIQKLGSGSMYNQIIYTNTETEAAFPMTYNDEYNDDYSGSGGNIQRSGISYGTADAYGTLLLPGGVVLRDVLRVKSESAYFDYHPGIVKGVTNLVYKWYTAASKEPVLCIEKETLSQDGSVYMMNQRAWLTNYATSNNLTTEVPPFFLSNPNNQALKVFGFDNSITYHYSIYGLDGRIIQKGSLLSQIPLTDYSDGLYLFEVRNQKNELIFRSKFIVNK